MCLQNFLALSDFYVTFLHFTLVLTLSFFREYPCAFSLLTLLTNLFSFTTILLLTFPSACYVLQVHLPNKQSVCFNDGENLEHNVNNEKRVETILTEFAYNEVHAYSQYVVSLSSLSIAKLLRNGVFNSHKT